MDVNAETRPGVLVSATATQTFRLRSEALLLGDLAIRLVTRCRRRCIFLCFEEKMFICPGEHSSLSGERLESF